MKNPSVLPSFDGLEQRLLLDGTTVYLSDKPLNQNPALSNPNITMNVGDQITLYVYIKFNGAAQQQLLYSAGFDLTQTVDLLKGTASTVANPATTGGNRWDDVAGGNLGSGSTLVTDSRAFGLFSSHISSTNGDSDPQYSAGAGFLFQTITLTALNPGVTSLFLKTGAMTLAGQSDNVQPVTYGANESQTANGNVPGTGGIVADATITVRGTSDFPVATTDTVDVLKNADKAVLNVLANDFFPQDPTQPLTISQVTIQPSHGTVQISEDKKTLLYTPETDYTGPDTFSYTVKASNNLTASAAVNINVTPAILAENDIANIQAGLTAPTAVNVLGNDRYPGGSNDTLLIDSVDTATYGTTGTVTISQDGKNLLYTPKAGFTGVDRVAYTITGPNNDTATAVAEVNVYQDSFTNLKVEVTSISLPSVAVPGQKGYAFVTISNPTNNTIASGKVNIDLYASLDQALKSDDVKLLSKVQTVKLAKGQSKQLKIAFTLPRSLAEGSYYIAADIDAANAWLETDKTDNLSFNAQANTVQWAFGAVGGLSNVKLTVPDSTGNLVTFSLSGSGTGRVYGGNDFDGGVWLSDTTAKSSLTISSHNPVTMRSIAVQDGTDPTKSLLKSISAKNVNLTFGVLVNGGLGSLTIGDVLAPQFSFGNITIGSAMATSITMGNVRDVEMLVKGNIKSLSVKSWTSSSEAATGVIRASTIGKLTSKGDFGVGMQFGYSGMPENNIPPVILGSATIYGDLSGGWAPQLGIINSITVKGKTSNWALIGAQSEEQDDGTVTPALDLYVNKLSFREVENSSLLVTRNLASLTATKWTGGYHLSETEQEPVITTNYLGSMSIAGDISGKIQVAGYGIAANQVSVNKIKVGGTVDSSTWMIGGNVNSIEAGMFKSSAIYQGVDDTPEYKASDFGNNRFIIGKLTFTGVDGKYFEGNGQADSGSEIEAYGIGAIKFSKVPASLAGNIFAVQVGTGRNIPTQLDTFGVVRLV